VLVLSTVISARVNPHTFTPQFTRCHTRIPHPRILPITYQFSAVLCHTAPYAKCQKFTPICHQQNVRAGIRM